MKLMKAQDPKSDNCENNKVEEELGGWLGE